MAEFKFFCPQCGRHIQCDTSYSGQQINCPVCQQAIVVPQAPRAASAVSPPVAAQSRALRNVLVAVAALLVLAGLAIGGWYGWSKFKFHKFPQGLVALWSGADNGDDLVSGKSATLTDISFVEDKTRKAFSFNGSTSSIKISASPALDVGQGDGFTVMAWIKPFNLAEQQRNPIFEWNNGVPGQTVTWGVLLVMLRPYENNLGAGNLWAELKDTDADGKAHLISARGGTLTANIFQHVALTYDKASGIARLFCNGAIVAEQNLGHFTPQTSYDFYIGRRPAGDVICSFTGLMDEISIYNRALSADEIQAIYTKQK